MKTRKTAGTSVEIALSFNAGKSDIVTPLIIEDEITRLHMGGHPPVNWAKDPAVEAQYMDKMTAQSGNAPDKLEKVFFRNDANFFNHMAPADIINNLGADVFFLTRTK